MYMNVNSQKNQLFHNQWIYRLKFAGLQVIFRIFRISQLCFQSSKNHSILINYCWWSSQRMLWYNHLDRRNHVKNFIGPVGSNLLVKRTFSRTGFLLPRKLHICILVWLVLDSTSVPCNFCKSVTRSPFIFLQRIFWCHDLLMKILSNLTEISKASLEYVWRWSS